MKPILTSQTIEGLRWIVEILNRNHIPYQLVGGLAAKIYGSARDINDIDIDILSLDSLLLSYP